MNIFKGIEKKLEGLVEGGFGRAFKSSVQPVELAHKLAKEMADHKTVGVANVYVPNEFDVYLGHDDYEHLSSFSDALMAELGNYVVAYARREGWTLVAPPHIELHEDADLRLGEFGIGTRAVKEPSVPASAVVPAQPPSAPVAAPVPPLVVPAAAAPAAPVAAPGPLIDHTVLYEAPRPPVAAPARPVGSSRARLSGPGGSWELRNTVTVVGRSRRCDIIVDDANVSRQHAEIRRQADGYLVRDLDSTNGLRVNRREVKQAVLQHGDRIEMGTTELLFERLP
jgi:hypothetical protein